MILLIEVKKVLNNFKKGGIVEVATVKKVNASYEVLSIFNNVLVSVPGQNDLHMKEVNGHKIKTANGLIITIPKHWRRGDFFSGHLVTKRFYGIKPEFFGRKMIVAEKVKVMKKTDHHTGESFLILDIIGVSKNIKANYRLKVGSPKEGFNIPGTALSVRIEYI
jgi:hypothetical protein